MCELSRKLQAPFSSEDVEWRAQRSGVRNGKPWAMMLAYITNRAIQQRLDEIFGVMGWKNDGRMSFLYEDFQKDIIGQYPRGDQAYVSDKIREVGIRPEWVQTLFPGIYSYRRACRNSLPADARFICFHGKPRPHEVRRGWVRDYWK